jgi:hypothetical protein
VLRGANLALKFLVELAAFAALAYWGATTGSAPLSIALAVAAPAIAIVLWGLFAAPKAGRRLPAAARIPFELAVFAVAIVALFVAGAPVAGAVLAALVVLNAALLTIFDQWEA